MRNLFKKTLRASIPIAVFCAVFATGFLFNSNNISIKPEIAFAVPTPGIAVTDPIEQVKAGGAALADAVDVGGKIMAAGGRFLSLLFLQIGAFITWLGGMLFDKSMEWAVVDFGAHIRATSGGETALLEEAINKSWGTVRDICNLAFIFGFIYIGIRTIIDPDSASIKRFLSRIIIGAILINFSLYLTQVVIDFTNFTAVQVYNDLVPLTPNGEGQSISERIAAYLGIQTFFSEYNPNALSEFVKDGSVVYALTTTVFLAITGFTLAAGGILLLIRFGELVLIMIFSPLLFAARVFPQTEEWAGKIFGKLISSAFFAPVYLLLIYLSLALANGMVREGTVGFAQVLNRGPNSPISNQDPGFFVIVVNFVIITFFMISALTLASKMSVWGGKMAVTAGNGARNKVTGAIGRNFVGRPAGWALEAYKKSDANTTNMPGVRGKLNRGVRWAFDRAGVTETVQNTLEKGKKGKYGGSRTYEESDKWQKNTDSERTKINETANQAAAVAQSVQAAANVAKNPADPAAQKALLKAQSELQKTILEASTEQITKLLGKFKTSSAEYAEIVRELSHQQFEKVMDAKEEDFSDSAKADLQKERRRAILARLLAEENKRRSGATPPLPPIANVTDSGSRALSFATQDELATLDFSSLYATKETAASLTAAQLDEMKKDKKRFVDAQIRQLESERTSYFNSIVSQPNPAVRDTMIQQIWPKKAKDVVKLPKNLLEHRDVSKYISVDIIDTMMNEKIDRGTQESIIRNLTLLATPDMQPGVAGYLDGAYMRSRFGAQLNGWAP